ncbi:MAG TPA: hypothetical protein VGI39_14655 [Polyangiaceae bacterium]|jgi:hypothetical protein
MSPPLEPLPAALQSWQNFYLLAGTAAATLTGLMFVAVTFGSSLVTKESATSARAFLDPTFTHFVQVLMTSCLLTVPTVGPRFLGSLLVVAGLARLAGLHWVFHRYREAHRAKGDVEISDWVVSIVMPFACHVLLVATGAAFLMHREADALLGLATVTIVLLFIGIYGAWELLVWMALAVAERKREAVEPRGAHESRDDVR